MEKSKNIAQINVTIESLGEGRMKTNITMLSPSNQRHDTLESFDELKQTASVVGIIVDQIALYDLSAKMSIVIELKKDIGHE